MARDILVKELQHWESLPFLMPTLTAYRQAIEMGPRELEEEVFGKLLEVAEEYMAGHSQRWKEKCQRKREQLQQLEASLAAAEEELSTLEKVMKEEDAQAGKELLSGVVFEDSVFNDIGELDPERWPSSSPRASMVNIVEEVGPVIPEAQQTPGFTEMMMGATDLTEEWEISWDKPWNSMISSWKQKDHKQ
mmetsp:Transcript_18802/g.23119  ORF Transcript_18802/g.23119 Transcript_18802/m.23119 type:complete len:191 (-) Transcript_18802:52-624(-)